MRKCRACVGGAEGRAGVGEAGCAASAQRTQTTGDADLTACARTSRLPARTSRLLARTSRLRARADCVGVRAAARADRADARAPLGATYARATLTHGRFLVLCASKYYVLSLGLSYNFGMSAGDGSPDSSCPPRALARSPVLRCELFHALLAACLHPPPRAGHAIASDRACS